MSRFFRNYKQLLKYICIILVYLLLFVFICCNKKDTLLTAEQLYNYKLNLIGFDEYGIKMSEKQLEDFVVEAQKRMPDKDYDELYNLAKNFFEAQQPSTKLNFYLNDLLANNPAKKNKFPGYFVGEYPMFNINATTTLAPNGDVLVLLNYGLTKAFYEWSKLFVNILFIYDKSSGFKIDAPLEELIQLFKESIIDYLKDNKIPKFPQIAKDDKLNIASVLSMSATEFIIAHELAHAFLGDLIKKESLADYTFDHTESWNKEIEADKYGMDIFLNNVSTETLSNTNELLNMEVRIAGTFYCLALFEMIEKLRIDEFGIKNSDFQFYFRWYAMHEYLEEKLGDYTKQYSFTNNVMIVLTEIIGKILQKEIPENAMQKDTKLLKELYIAYKDSNKIKLKNIISNNINLTKVCINKLIKSFEIYLGMNLLSVDSDWSAGDSLEVSTLYNFTLTINEIYKEIQNEDAYENIIDLGLELTNWLIESSNKCYNDNRFSESNNKLRQAKNICAKINEVKGEEYIKISPIQDRKNENIKNIIECNDDEIELIKNVCQYILNKLFDEDIFAWYKEEYYFIPHKTDEWLEEVFREEDLNELNKLKKPIQLAAALLKYSYFRKEDIQKIKNKFEAEINSNNYYVDEMKIEILEYLIIRKTIGSYSNMSEKDKLIIFPKLIRITH